MGTSRPILIVEDDRDLRELLVEALVDEGHPVVAAIDGVDALERLRTMPALPRLILLDLMMPRMNGTELREELRKQPDWSEIPIVVITAHAQGRANANALGASAYLQKPLKLATLFETVAQLLQTESS